MKIKEIVLKNFRCYSSFSLKFVDGINLVFGPNACGKTSIVEGVYVLGLTKSFRANSNFDLIKVSSDNFFVKGVFEHSGTVDVVTVLNTIKDKKVKRNNEIVKSLSSFIGFVDVVLFSPADLILFSGSPGTRRKEFDIMLCQLSKQYLLLSSQYRKLLKERNAVLKECNQRHESKSLTLLNVVTEQLVEAGKKIIDYRERFIKKLNPMIKAIHSDISSNQETLSIQYKPSVRVNDYLNSIKRATEEDIKKCTTSVGPHRDDYEFLLNSKNSANYGSQGQQRNAILSIKLSLVDLIYEVKKEYPIVLLDDVFSELDKERQNKVIKILKPEVQTIITSATLSDIDLSAIKSAKFIQLKFGGEVYE